LKKSKEIVKNTRDSNIPAYARLYYLH